MTIDFYCGNEISDFTIYANSRGEVSIYDSRLTIYGCIQPGLLAELVNYERVDSQ